MALNWTLSLKDNFSAAANRGAASAKKLSASMEGLNKVDDAFARASKKRAELRAEISKANIASHRKEVEAFQKSRQVAMKSQQEGGGLTASGVALGTAAGNMISGAVTAGLDMLVGKVKEFGEGVFSGATMRQSIDAGMEKLTGGTQQAQAAFDKISAKAKELGAPILKTVSQTQSLMAMGFKLDGSQGALKVLEMTRAIKTISPAANVDNIIMAMSQIQGKGKLMSEELKGQLGDAGVNVPYVMDALATKLHKTRDEVEKLMQKGKITSEMGFEAIFQSIERQGGHSLHELAVAGANNFNSLKERLMSLPEDLGAKLKLTKPIETMSTILNELMDKLGSANLGPIFDNVTSAIKTVFDMFKGVDLVGPITSVSEAFKTIAGAAKQLNLGDAFQALADISGDSIKSFGEGFAAAMDGMEGLDPNEIRESAHAFAELGLALGQLIGYGVRAGAFLQRIGAFANWPIRGVVAGWEHAADIFETIGGIFAKMTGLAGLGQWFGQFKGLGDVFKSMTGLAGLGQLIDEISGPLDDMSRLTFDNIRDSLSSLFFDPIVLPNIDINNWIDTQIEAITTAATNLGKSIADGVTSGITSGVQGAADALTGLATNAISAAAGAVGAHSPADMSWDKLGVPIGSGTTGGIQQEAPNAARALADLASGAIQNASPAGDQGFRAGQMIARGFAASNGDASSRTINLGGINVQAIDQQLIAEGTLEFFRSAVNRHV